MKNKLSEILEQEKVLEIIPFLKSLDASQRKSLVKPIRETIKEYMENEQDRKNRDKRYNQCVIISIAAFVCLDYNDYKRNMLSWSYLSPGFIKFHEYSQQYLMKKIHLDDILEWYCPDWFSDYLNSGKTNPDFQMASYDEVMKWYGKGYMTLSDELVVATLSRAPFVYEMVQNGHGHYTFHPEKLLADPLTMDQHIWLLFRYHSNVYLHLYWGLKNKDDDWAKIFRMLVDQGQTDRLRILRECLLTANRNFNKLLSGWFSDLFTSLAPTTDELISIQDELFSSLSSVQTKVVNHSLVHIRNICTSDHFAVDHFLSYLPVLLTSETKAIGSNTIAVIEKILKTGYAGSVDLCRILSMGLVSKDEAVQTRIAKLIVRYGNVPDLSDDIAGYADNLLMSVRPILSDYLDGVTLAEETVIIPDHPATGKESVINEGNRIPEITGFDDFVFFVTQAFDNNEPYHSFMLPAYILRFDKEITGGNVNQLEPAFKKAVRTVNIWSNNIGLLDRTFAPFFISYGHYLVQKYPDQTKNIAGIINGQFELANWRSKMSHIEIYPFYFILLKVWDSIKNNRDFEILSTPTHQPLWIDPETLVSRLIRYQGQNLKPYSFDLQLAIQRCAPDDTGKALKMAKEHLNGEIAGLMCYFLDKEVTLKDVPEHPAWWMTAAMARNRGQLAGEAGLLNFDYIPEEYITGNFGWEIEKNKFGEFLKIHQPDFKMKSITDTTLFSEYGFSAKGNKHIWNGDVMRLICSYPYNNDAVLADILSHIANYTMLDQGMKNDLLYALQSLHILRQPLTGTGHLFLAVCLLCPEKTIKDYASALWADFTFNLLRNDLLGTETGKLTRTGWLPLKRLTDIIQDHMLNISIQHNKKLEELVASIMIRLDDPVTNLKKLLEIYNELCSLNSSRPDKAVMQKLESWKDNSSLKKIIRQLSS